MTPAVCARCQRQLPAPADGGGAPALAACPFCGAPAGDATRKLARAPSSLAVSRARPAGAPRPAATGPRRTSSIGAPPPPKKRADVFASALTADAERATPVHPFTLPPDAVPSPGERRRKGPTAVAYVAAPPVAPAPIALPAAAPAQVAPAAADAAPSAGAPSPTISSATSSATSSASSSASSPAISSAISSATEHGERRPTPTGQPFLAEWPSTLPMNVGLGPRLVAAVRRIPGQGLWVVGLSAAIILFLGTTGLRILTGSQRRATPVAVAVPGSPTQRSLAAAPPVLVPLPRPAPAAPIAAERPAVDDPDTTPPAASPPLPPPHAQKVRVKHSVKARATVKRGVRETPRLATRRRAAARSVAASDDAAPAEVDRIAHARASYRQGNERLFQGDAPAAIAAYQEAVRLNPKDAAGYRGLGLAYAQQGKRTEAVRYLRVYLKHARNVDDRALISSRIALLASGP